MYHKSLHRFFENNKENVYFLFRIVIAFLFFGHGAQKLYGWFGGHQVQLMSIYGLAGFIEFYGGILIFFGLFTRYAAFLAVCDMIGAWLIVHLKHGILPATNGGEVSLFYFVAFLFILFKGPGKWALDNKFFRKMKSY